LRLTEPDEGFIVRLQFCGFAKGLRSFEEFTRIIEFIRGIDEAAV